MSDDEEIALTNGHWRIVRGIKRWVPDTHAPERMTRIRFRRLLAERYAAPTWWRSHLWDDSPTTTAQRRADMAADFAALDGRSRDIKRGALEPLNTERAAS